MTASNNKHKHKDVIMNTRLPLVLAQFHAGVYNPNTACAYIYYGDAKQQKTHEGKVIGEFMSEIEQTRLNKHVTDAIIPFVNSALSTSAYVTNGFDNLNMAPHPYIVIQRKDLKPITDEDLAAIQNILEAAIQKRNNITNHWAKSGFFNRDQKDNATTAKTVSWGGATEIQQTTSLSDSDADDEEIVEIAKNPEPTHGYNLRSRK